MVSRRRLREFWLLHADAEDALKSWYRTARRATWNNLVDVRQVYASAEAVGPYTIFNIKGNAYRLIVKIEYRFQAIYVKDVLTHAAYDRTRWK